jgi:iron complex outermembrane receptor protein
MPERMRMEGQTGRRSARIATAVSAVLRGVSICAPLAICESPAALAQTFEARALAADIPAQPLAQALTAFGRQTGLQVLYVSGVVDQRRSHAVSAGLGAQDALTRMLEGTGLKFEHLTPRSIRILVEEVPLPRQPTAKLPPGDELQEVIVTANRRDEDLQTVPMTIQV